MGDITEEEYLRLPSLDDVVFCDGSDPRGGREAVSNIWNLVNLNGFNKLKYKEKCLYKLTKKLNFKSKPDNCLSYKVPIVEGFKEMLLQIPDNSINKIKSSQQKEVNNQLITMPNSNEECSRITQERSFQQTLTNNNHGRSKNTSSNGICKTKQQDYLLSSDSSDSEQVQSNTFKKSCVMESGFISGRDKDMISKGENNAGKQPQIPDNNITKMKSTEQEVKTLNTSNEKCNGINQEKPLQQTLTNKNHKKSKDISSDALYQTKKQEHLLSSESSDSEQVQSNSFEESLVMVNGCTSISEKDIMMSRGGNKAREQSQSNGDHAFTEMCYKEISKYSNLLSEDLRKNNHVWILQCPASLDCSKLVGQNLSLDENCKLQVGEKCYETFSFQSKESRVVSLAIPSHNNHFKLRRIPIKGNIIVEDYLDITSDSSFSNADVLQRVQLPDNVYTRHPLLGKDYKKHLKQTKKTLGLNLKSIKKEPQNSDSDVHNPDLNLPNEKKKKKRKRESIEFENFSGSDHNIHSSFCPPKKKKVKKENSTDMDLYSKAITTNCASDGDSFLTPSKKKKRNKL